MLCYSGDGGGESVENGVTVMYIVVMVVMVMTVLRR